MLNALSPFLTALLSVFRSRAALQVEILALRHQIGVLRRSAKKRLKLTVADRLLWAWLSGAAGHCAAGVQMVGRSTVRDERPPQGLLRIPFALPRSLSTNGTAQQCRVNTRVGR